MNECSSYFSGCVSIKKYWYFSFGIFVVFSKFSLKTCFILDLIVRLEESNLTVKICDESKEKIKKIH